jgi:hypothetical protein
MTIFQDIATACLVISVLLALMFLALAAVKMVQMVQAMCTVKRGIAGATPVAGSGLAAAKQGAIVVPVDKILEAFAKLTDSLSKAPLSVVCIVMALLFMGLALWSADTGKEPPASDVTKTAITATPLPGIQCTVIDFVSGEHALPQQVRDQPSGCLDDLAKQLDRDELGALLVVGRCDIQELKAAARRRYHENFILAYQRGIAVQDYLDKNLHNEALKRLDQRLLVLAGGPQQLGPGDLDKDRVVELSPFWIEHSKIIVPAT